MAISPSDSQGKSLQANVEVVHCENVDQAKALAGFLWNEMARHEDDIRVIKEDLVEIERKWGVTPDGTRKFVKP